MAEAYARGTQRVNLVSEAVLAELIQRDVQQLTEAALGDALGSIVVVQSLATFQSRIIAQ